jgi:endonuclease/exonuclease/phosphatase family metal-dependent hydrolase
MTLTTLKIVSWNLEDFGIDADSPGQTGRRQAQVRLLREEAPDIVCLQELWDDSPDHSRLPELFRELATGLNMRGEVVLAPRSHCHMALLWRPWIILEEWETYDWTFHHGMGVASLDVKGKDLLRVGVAHAAPSNPQQRFSEAFYVARLGDPEYNTIVGADWNCPGTDDPEPDWASLRPDEIVRRAMWSDDPDQPPKIDRRPAHVLHRAGLVDVAQYLKRPWRATTIDRLRVDGFRVSRDVLDAVLDYGVFDGGDMFLSNHFPVWMTLDRSAL